MTPKLRTRWWRGTREAKEAAGHRGPAVGSTWPSWDFQQDSAWVRLSQAKREMFGAGLLPSTPGRLPWALTCAETVGTVAALRKLCLPKLPPKPALVQCPEGGSLGKANRF